MGLAVCETDKNRERWSEHTPGGEKSKTWLEQGHGVDDKVDAGEAHPDSGLDEWPIKPANQRHLTPFRHHVFHIVRQNISSVGFTSRFVPVCALQ